MKTKYILIAMFVLIALISMGFIRDVSYVDEGENSEVQYKVVYRIVLASSSAPLAYLKVGTEIDNDADVATDTISVVLPIDKRTEWRTEWYYPELKDSYLFFEVCIKDVTKADPQIFCSNLIESENKDIKIISGEAFYHISDLNEDASSIRFRPFSGISSEKIYLDGGQAVISITVHIENASKYKNRSMESYHIQLIESDISVTVNEGYEFTSLNINPEIVPRLKDEKYIYDELTNGKSKGLIGDLVDYKTLAEVFSEKVFRNKILFSAFIKVDEENKGKLYIHDQHLDHFWRSKLEYSFDYRKDPIYQMSIDNKQSTRLAWWGIAISLLISIVSFILAIRSKKKTRKCFEDLKNIFKEQNSLPNKKLSVDRQGKKKAEH